LDAARRQEVPRFRRGPHGLTARVAQSGIADPVVPARDKEPMIPTKVHGVLDYTVGLFLIASPWLLGFFRVNTATWVPIVLGGSALLYSLFTDYEWGVVKRMPMRVHLGLDAGSGLFLAVSPWLLGFADEVWVPHLVLGLFEIAAATLTRRHPPYRAPAAART